jgi:XapX domain-containing protein
MGEIAIGLGLGLLIGAGCRLFDIPVPAPPRIVGALLVVAMTLGFLGTDLALGRWGSAQIDARPPTIITR